MKRFLLIGLLACSPIFGKSPLADATTPLIEATRQDNAAKVQGLLKSGADANQTNRYGVAPLALACESGNAEIVDALLAAGADPNTRQRGGETVLMIAARTGKVEPIKSLLSRGADVNARERRGQTAIMWAAAEGHTRVVDLLIKENADFKTPLDGGFTPLLFAVRDGRSEVVKTLLKAGADINEAAQPKRRAGRGPQPGMTPLMVAVENGHFELALDLINAGAAPNDLRPGYAALHAISWVRKPELGEGEDGLPPPDGSGRVDSLEFVRELVKAGAEVNLRMPKNFNSFGGLNKAGATPFLLAAKTADIALLKLLYELGADPSIPTSAGATPLIAAAGLGTLAAGEVAGTEEEVVEVVEWLIKDLKADVNVVDKNGETAMHAAAYKNLPKVVELLASHGAKIEVWNQKNKQGWTPLLIAEGFRPGNFKPSFETIASIHKVMIANGVTPPPLTPHEGVNNSDFGPRERKYGP